MADEVKMCPECGGEVLPVLYGMPTPEAFEAAERGEFRLGGCVVGPDDVLETCECGATRTLRSEWIPPPSSGSGGSAHSPG